MANTKTTSRKQKVEPVVVINEQPDLNENILIMNNTYGTLYIVNKRTGRPWDLQSYGASAYMTFGDVLDVNASMPAIFQEGWALIADERSVEFLGLTEQYKHIIKPQDMPQFLQLPENDIKAILSDAPGGMKQTVARYIKQNEMSVDSISRRKLFEKLLNINFDE